MCFERCKTAPQLCSTKGWEKNIVFSGTFNPNNGGMKGFTHSLLGYTSSDAFLGQTQLTEFVMVGGTKIQEPSTPGTYFQGLSMGIASLKKLMMWGLGQKKETTLVVSGCSAAAIGLAPLTDMFPGILQAQAEANGWPYFQPNIFVIPDSAPITNGPPPINGEMPLPDQSQALLYMLYTMQGLNPGLQSTYPSCYASFGNLCIWSPYVYPYLTVPNLVMHNMWDSFALGNQAGLAVGILNSTGYIWSLKLVFQENEVMSKCTNKQTMFGLNCYDHCYVENPWWWRLAPATAKDPYWKWSAKDAFISGLSGSLGHKVMDELVQTDSGCIGQEYTNNLFGRFQFLADVGDKSRNNGPGPGLA